MRANAGRDSTRKSAMRAPEGGMPALCSRSLRICVEGWRMQPWTGMCSRLAAVSQGFAGRSSFA